MTSADLDPDEHPENPQLRRNKSTNDMQSVPRAGTLSGNEIPFMLGRYEVVAELGAGAMGTVYKGRDKVLDRDVAIKVPKLENSDVQSQMLQRFYREARAVARLSHPSICPIYDVGEIDGKVFIAMGFVKGSTLDRAVGKGRFLPPRAAAKLIHRICVAMQHAHDHQVVHRDLKTSNIMTDSNGLPVLLDFGLAMLRDEKDTGVTHQGQILGSPAYMSPEQVNGRRVDHRSDIFSLGVVFYEALTGRRPYQGSMPQVLMGILQGVCDAPHAVNKDVPKELSDLCLKMMATSVDRRFQTMAECAAALAEYQKISASGTSGSVPRSDLGTATNPKVRQTTSGRSTSDRSGTNKRSVQSSVAEPPERHPQNPSFPSHDESKPNSSDGPSVDETHPTTDPSVRSLLERAAEIDWQTIKYQKKRRVEAVESLVPEVIPPPWWQSRKWIAIGIILVGACSVLAMLFSMNSRPETPLKSFADEVERPSAQGTEAIATKNLHPDVSIPPPDGGSAATAEKKKENPKATFSLDELDSPP